MAFQAQGLACFGGNVAMWIVARQTVERLGLALDADRAVFRRYGCTNLVRVPRFFETLQFSMAGITGIRRDRAEIAGAASKRSRRL
jgi:hypothetical protein